MNERHENCHVEPVMKPVDDSALNGSLVAYLAVRGMGCERCAMRVRNGLLNLDGVLLCDVYLEHGVAVAAFDPNRVEKAELLTAVAEAGNDGRHHYHANILEVKPLPETITSSEEGRTRV